MRISCEALAKPTNLKLENSLLEIQKYKKISSFRNPNNLFDVI